MTPENPKKDRETMAAATRVMGLSLIHIYAVHSTTAEDVDYVLTLEEVLGMLDARGLCNGIMQKSDNDLPWCT